MSLLLRAQNLTLNVGHDTLFRELTFNINVGDRIGLVGHNGCGKSTLLAVLAGDREPDAGHLQQQRGLNIAQVEQFVPGELLSRSLVEAASLGQPVDEAWRAEAMLHALGFTDSQWRIPVSALSGGQHNRLMFARALLASPDLLLLDEPTNHLDMATLVMFEATLAAFKGAFVLVSHDRAFLDEVTTTTLFIRDERAYRFDQSYSNAANSLAAMDAAAEHARNTEEQKIAKVAAGAKRLAQWGRTYDSEKFAKRARNMERRVERMQSERTFVSSGSPLDLDLAVSATRARQIAIVEDLRVAVGERELFQVPELIIRPGERIGLLGNNGVGKTTFIKALVTAFEAHLESSGTGKIRFSDQTTLGYYDQELDRASGDVDMVAFIRSRAELDEQSIRGRLIQAGFAYATHGQRMLSLSGGERARVLFVLLSIQRPNFLILDEPTNHIDIRGKEQLEEQLGASDAAMLITSHDRHFLNTVATRYLWIRDSTITWLDSPETFYQCALPNAPIQLNVEAGLSDKTGQTETSNVRGEPAPGATEDDLLVRIVTLEDKLTADEARKAKFQKPDLQAQWRTEIARLYEQLEEL